MKLEIDLTEKESRLIHTFIRRSDFEQYLRNMSEAGDTKDQAETRAYDTISAFTEIRDAIEGAFNK